MDREKFLRIAQRAVGQNRGWQTELAKLSERIAHHSEDIKPLNQSTISQIYTNTKPVSRKAAATMREIARFVLNGDIPNISDMEDNMVETDHIELSDDDIITLSDPDAGRSDEELMDEIRDEFEICRECMEDVMLGECNSLIVSSTPGMGKTHMGKEIIENHMLDTAYITGAATPIYVYKMGFLYIDKLIVFDDCDDVLTNLKGLDILKGLLNDKHERLVSYLSETDLSIEDQDGEKIKVPKSYTFEGSIVFFTNTNFNKSIEKDTKISKHLAALKSRSGYFHLHLDTVRRQWLRIKQLCRDTDIFENNAVYDQHQQNAILHFIEENREKFSELSPRLIVQCCEKIKARPQKWHQHVLRLYGK